MRGVQTVGWRNTLWSRPEVVNWVICVVLTLLALLATARQLRGW